MLSLLSFLYYLLKLVTKILKKVEKLHLFGEKLSKDRDFPLKYSPFPYARCKKYRIFAPEITEY